MAGFTITVNPAAGENIGEALEQFLTEKLGPRIAGNVRRTVPVRSGDLKRSVTVQVEQRGEESVLQVGYDPYAPGLEHPPMDYGRYVEFGTSRMVGQNHLRSAVYQARGSVG